ncbi:uncharacterized protein LOC134527383 isoform X2 [Bacillus rossius redtenbacheri]|uniref:uncharacterized protein LOC134527383 isoform X2 n=1 Tax=Bacillus rossius redtenbacheri TaxID=93214 RepID=UPI002FDE88AE
MGVVQSLEGGKKMESKAFESSVPSGAYRVQVASIIHPAAFWVVDPAGPDSGRAKVHDLERRLAKAVRSNERITTDVNRWVAIKNPNTGAWHRGLVNNIVQLRDKYVYVVFLADHGTCLQVEVDSLAELSRSFLRGTFQAFEVVLDALEPRPPDHGTGAARWPEEALAYVSQLLDTVIYTYFVPINVSGNKIYGELYLQDGTDCKSLSVLLCSNGYAKRCCSVWKSGEVENETGSLVNSTENVENSVEVDDGYISNYYIRKEKKNVKTNKKPKSELTKSCMKEPEFANLAKTKVVATKPALLEVWKQSPNKSGSLLESVEELMKKENFLVSSSPFSSQRQNISLRPASDNRGALDKNASAMYEDRKCRQDEPESKDNGRTDKASSSGNMNVDTNTGIKGETSVLINADPDPSISNKAESNVDSSTKDLKADEDERILDHLKKMEMFGHFDGNRSSEQATLCKITDTFRSRFDTFQLRDNLDMRRVLVHSHVPLEPAESIKDACFPLQIHKAMEKLNFKTAFNIQLHAWAAIMEGRNTFVVGPANSGKTLSYVLPLLSKCMSGTAFQEVKTGNAPNVLVLCPGYETARFVYYVCSKILQLAGICHVDIVLTHGGGAETEVMTQLLNGCHILISTPRCWLRLYQRSQLLTNLSRLYYLVLEDADELFSKFPEVKHIVQLCKKVSSIQNRDIVTVCVSETWTRHVGSLAAGMEENACVCIGSCLEAAIYAKLQPNLHFVAAEDKDKKVIRILKASYTLQRTVVVCLTRHEVEHLTTVLEKANMKVLQAHEEMPNYDLGEIRTRWLQSRRGNFPVLVCSDDVLLEMNVTDATALVHYNLPSSSKTQFGFRFSCLMSNFRSIFSNADIMNLDCSVHILVESSDVQPFATLVNFLRRLGGVLSPEIEAKYTEILKVREQQKVSSSVCHSLKAFGSCWRMLKCPNRHFFDRILDQTATLPGDGHVKVKVVHVHTANYFSVRLLEHWSSDGTRTVVENQLLSMAFKLHQLFSDLENRVQVANPTEGKVYAISSGGYHRVVCEKIQKNEVVVKFIDEGAVKTCKVYDLMPLPEELRCVPPQVVEVVVCGMAPPDDDTTWSMLATQAAFDWVSEMADNEDSGVYLAGKVVLSLGRTMWLSPLMGRQNLADIKTDIFVSSLKKELVQGGFAVPNPGHVDKLYKLCEEAEIFKVFDLTAMPHTATEDDDGSSVCEQSLDRRAHQDTLKEPKDCQRPSGVAETPPKRDGSPDRGVSEQSADSQTHQEPVKKPRDCQRPSGVVEAGPNAPAKRDSSLDSGVSEQSAVPVWESLPADVCEVELSLVSPGEFYVQKKQNSEQLEELTIEIQNYIANHRESVTAQPGLYCLGKWPVDNLWYRAKVVELFEDGRIELFSVDLGDFIVVSCNEVAVLPQTLLTKLSFQAIECELASVKSPHGNIWEDWIKEEFYNLASEEFNWSVEVLARSEPSTTGGMKHSVRLTGVNEHGCVDVNQELLNFGHASAADSDFDDSDVEFTEEEALEMLRKFHGAPPAPVSESNKIVELGDGESASRPTHPGEVMPPLASCARTPRLSWHQDAHWVCFEVRTPGADSCSVRCSRTHLQFRAAVSDVYYISLDLCGVIEPQESLCAQIVGGYHLKLRKQTAGFKWPYLVIPEKNVIKAKWSLDHIDVPEETDGIFSESKAGFLPRGSKSDESDKEEDLFSDVDEAVD